MTFHFTSQFPVVDVDALFGLLERHPGFKAQVDHGAPLPKALRHLGLELWSRGRLEEAVAPFTLATTTEPANAALHAELGSLLGALGKSEDAFRSLHIALELDPNQPQVWNSLAGIAVQLGRREIAEQAFLAALDLAPNSVDSLTGLGLLYVEQRRLELAVQRLRGALDCGATNMGIHACLGQALHLLGAFPEARQSLEKAAAAFPHQESIVRKYALAVFLESLIEQAPEAIAMAAYRHAAGIHREDEDAIRRAAFHMLAGYGHKDAALRLGKSILTNCPNDPIVAFQIDALEGRSRERAPDDYLTSYFDRFAPTFDKHLVEVLSYHVPDICCSMLSEAEIAASDILDLGCGTGLAAPRLSNFGTRLTGVDLSPRMLDKARERNLYDCLVESEAVAYLSGCKRNFDLIVSLDVLVYFGDLAPLFDAAAASLVAGGHFAISYESGQDNDYTLLSSGRFAHNNSYIERLFRPHFALIAQKELVLRYEANLPVSGAIALLRRT